jgi:pyruvate dehydrogenase E1 component
MGGPPACTLEACMRVETTDHGSAHDRDQLGQALREIEQRILWLAVRMVHEANRSDAGGIKVGGHQASSASMVTLMTTLWFRHLGHDDKVAVKPHASPVYHAIKYLTGELDRSYLTRLRSQGGLQAYPSRTKDPDVADYSTGSVGLGAVAPLFGAAARRYINHHFGHAGTGRFIATVGDAELDEGNVWEAVIDPMTAGLGNVMLIVDLNRQSLDRVVPGIAAWRIQQFFANAGWHVAEAKYGRRLQTAFGRPGGDALRAHIDAMPNEAYQALLGRRGADLRKAFLDGADPAVQRNLRDVDDADLGALLGDLGGHDHEVLIDAFRSCDQVDDRPSVVFAYTIKGWGLPMAGDPLNHSALLSGTQIDELRAAVGLTEETEWDRFEETSAAGRLCAEVGRRMNNVPPPPRPPVPAPATVARRRVTSATSTQEAFGRTMSALADVPGVGERIVTASPDVSISTNLGAWINKVGVYSPQQAVDYGGAERLLRWEPGPAGRHIELGISEMNLFLLLGQLGLAHEHHGELLLPVGTVYDPFVLRGLDALIYSVYSDARFIFAGTPSGVTLAPEGGAHQSTITPSVGLELPGLTAVEPAYAQEVDWLLCDGIRDLGRPGGESLYLRLSTRPVDQTPFWTAHDRLGADALRGQVLAGAYTIRDAAPDDDRPGVIVLATGAVLPDAIAAADDLDAEGVAVQVINLTSADRVYRDWQRGLRDAAVAARRPGRPHHLRRLAARPGPPRPVVSVHDGASHTLAWAGAALGVAQVPLGVDRFGESGRIDELRRLTATDTATIVNAALLALETFDGAVD